jgi:hypothetical protein
MTRGGTLVIDRVARAGTVNKWKRLICSKVGAIGQIFFWHLVNMLLIHLHSDLYRSSSFLSPRLLKTFVFTVFLHNQSICTITKADTDLSICIHVPGPLMNSMNGQQFDKTQQNTDSLSYKRTHPYMSQPVSLTRAEHAGIIWYTVISYIENGKWLPHIISFASHPFKAQNCQIPKFSIATISVFA